jgi:hypothetical protein
MAGNGELFKTTLLMGLGVIVGGVTVGHALSTRAPGELSLAGLFGAPSPVANLLPDPLVTGSVGQAPPGKTIILDPCTGMRRN